ncbi:hypothetical protein [Methylobacterium nonmethylotrophicum]|uniref:Uncharacterized protein n=1 Tax=Methylobacterium nonmethylotrophicum TaxID=1141884 RepID=A0A4Z0NLS9_9HYPH|nr:hypothetical protein [Methylobacterium nonmethylotrophicum]TGD96472.1 hypothetical protein EU555_23755 [Methylobacterium nonmethylotrophicum]
MGLLDGLGRHLGDVLAVLFDDAVLHRAGVADEPVRARRDGAREASEEPGLPGRLVRIIVLTPGPAPDPDDEITLAGTRYRIVAVETDPAGSHAIIQGRPL